MPEKDVMTRVKYDIYIKLNQKRLQLMEKYKCNYTVSEVIEICLLEANIYEEQQK